MSHAAVLEKPAGTALAAVTALALAEFARLLPYPPSTLIQGVDGTTRQHTSGAELIYRTADRSPVYVRRWALCVPADGRALVDTNGRAPGEWTIERITADGESERLGPLGEPVARCDWSTYAAELRGASGGAVILREGDVIRAIAVRFAGGAS